MKQWDRHKIHVDTGAIAMWWFEGDDDDGISTLRL